MPDARVSGVPPFRRIKRLTAAPTRAGIAPLTPSSSPPSVLGMTSVTRMMRKGQQLARPFVAGLAVWIFAFGVIIPSLDQDLLSSEVMIGSGDHEACGRPHHDHTICIQFGRQDWSRSSSIPLEVFPPAASESVVARHDVPVELLRRIPSQSRAPPQTT